MDEATTHARSQAPVESGGEVAPGSKEEMPRVPVTRRNVLVATLFVGSALAFLYFVLPKLTGLSETWDRLGDGDPWWLGLAVGLEILSFWGYVLLFRAVFVRGPSRIGWGASYQITMAGLAATRLFAAAGAGGIALTAWAVRRSGMEARVVACRMWAFLVLLYAVYMGALLIDGLFLRIGLFPGSAPFALTIVPAIFAGAVILVMLAVSLLPTDMERLARSTFSSPRLARWARRIATVPATMATGTRTAISILRSGDPGVLGAVAWWGFDIAVLWACFHAFGDAPPQAVIVMGYFVGMLANTLPLPGGIGGVDGGMIGAFIAFGVDSGLAVVAVLVYRGIAFWLPTLPGAVAYLQLRHTVHRWEEEPAPA
jgi:putative heme transporter